MKIFAYYLPQFHCIPENDKWWGKGFTEWTNVKKATPLFKNHVQPKHPLNNNYYSLDKVETLKWQSELLKKYKVDGLIFYHYYFKGKKLLEKPAEMLLENKDLDINYFFCWANHSWIRSWEGNKELLIEQTYGNKSDWAKHFEYLLPFFKDARYEKKDNKPVILLFKSQFKEKSPMFEYFDKKCKENGFNGICLIETIELNNIKNLKDYYYESSYEKFYHLREPGTSLLQYTHNPCHLFSRIINKIKKERKLIRKYSGQKLYKAMDYKINNDKVIRGLFFEWDNTPRHQNRGYVITPPKKKQFMKYMNEIKEDKYVFVNAWNEWCEGMIMEPTEENGFKYLEWIKEWKDSENRTNGM